MKFSSEKPTVFEKIKKRFPFVTDAKWNEGLIIAYGDTIYSVKAISEDLKIHEGVHLKQQAGMNKDEWWNKFLNDDAFRLKMELEAYGAQIRWINQNVKDRNKAFALKKFHIDNLCSPLYGSMIEKSEAWKLLDKK